MQVFRNGVDELALKFLSTHRLLSTVVEDLPLVRFGACACYRGGKETSTERKGAHAPGKLSMAAWVLMPRLVTVSVLMPPAVYSCRVGGHLEQKTVSLYREFFVWSKPGLLGGSYADMDLWYMTDAAL
jgi:hypothetical protein